MATISLSKSEIPEYLHDTQFYSALSSEDEEISVPSLCFKENSQVTSVAGYVQLLNVARFWGFKKIPDSIVEFSFVGDVGELENAASEFQDELVYLKDLKDIRACELDSQLSEAITRGYVEIVNYLFTHGHELAMYSTAEAASHGHLAVLEFLHTNGAEWTSDTPASAAAAGHLSCLKYAHENECPWDETTAMGAAEGGHLDCLQYAHTQGCPWDDDTINGAARGGHLDCLEYAHSNACSISSMATYAAAGRGHLSCLVYLLEHGAEWDDEGGSAAAAAGSLECLQYLVENDYPLGNAIDFAAEAGHLECMKFCFEHGSSLSTSTPVKAASAGNLECLQFAVENGAELSAELSAEVIIQASYGHVECLRYALEKDCPMDVLGYAVPAAFCGGHLECVKLQYEAGYLWPENLFGDAQAAFNAMRPVEQDQLLAVINYALETGWEWSPATVDMLAQYGMVDLVKRARASGIELTAQMAVNTASAGQAEMLEYLLSTGCPVSEEIQTGAFNNMHLDCMVCAHKHNCPWPTDLMHAYVFPNENLLPCVKFAYDHGCPLDPITCEFAAINSLPDLLAYAHEVGCPWDASLTSMMVNYAKENGATLAVMACLDYAIEQDCPISEEDKLAYDAIKADFSAF